MAVITEVALKQHLRIPADNTDEDALLTAKIAASEEWIAAVIGKPFEDFEGGVPEPLKEAIRQLAGHLYENREATFDTGGTLEAIPFGLMTLITPYRERFTGAVRAVLPTGAWTIAGFTVPNVKVTTARFMRDPDNIHSHAIVSVEAIMRAVT